MTDRERLFEALYGYPLKLAEQASSGNIINGQFQEEFATFHADRLEALDGIMKDMGLDGN